MCTQDYKAWASGQLASITFYCFVAHVLHSTAVVVRSFLDGTWSAPANLVSYLIVLPTDVGSLWLHITPARKKVRALLTST